MRTFPKTLAFASVLMGLAACKTSGDVRSQRTGYVDPTEVKTLDSGETTTVAVKEDNAPLPSNVEALQRQVAVLLGELENSKVQARKDQEATAERIASLENDNRKLQEELTQIKSRPVAKEDVPSPVGKGSTGANSLWDLAVKDYKAGHYKEMTASLESFVKGYSADKRFLQAQLGLGMGLYKLRRYKDAAVVFNNVIDKNPKRVSDAALAWLGGGASLAQLGQHEEAKLFFEEVSRRWPKTDEGKKAKLYMSRKAKVPADLFPFLPNWSRAG